MRSIGLLIKPASGNCQLRCRYCFYEDLTASRTAAGAGLMSLDTLERLIKAAVSETDGSVSLLFQGGEPTLVGLDFYRRLIELEKQYKEEFNKGHLLIEHAIQTNGLLIDEEWCEFFAQNRFLVGVSLDGTKDIHDANRVDAAGRGTYSRVLKAAKLMERHGVDFNILCVVTSELARHAKKVYRSLVSEGFSHLQFIPCIDDFDVSPGSRPHSLTADRYARFLIDLYDEWYTDLVAGRYTSVRHFDNWVRMLQGRPPDTCSMSGRCTCYGVVEADGTVYPCDFYVLDRWSLGSILERSLGEMLSSETAGRFVAESTVINEQCRGCKYYFICRGGCRRDREPLDEGVGGLNIYCEAYRTFFEHALPGMRTIARSC